MLLGKGILRLATPPTVKLILHAQHISFNTVCVTLIIGNMTSQILPSVLIIGAGGYLGKPMCEEFLAQKSKFKRIAILTTEERKAKFRTVEADGLELVLGSFLDPSSFRGIQVHHQLHHFASPDIS